MKPPRWNASAATSSFRPLWRGLTAAWPVWEGRGIPYDVSGFHRDAISLPSGWSWVATLNGFGLHSTAAGGPIVIADSQNFPNAGPFSIIMVVDNIVDVGIGFSAAISLTGAWGFSVEVFDDTGKIGFTKIAVVDLASTFDSPYGVYAVFGVTVAANNNPTIYYNGQEDNLSNTASFGAATGDIEVGSATNWEGDILGVYLWDRALTRREHEIVQQDPFGIVRYARGLPVYPHYTAKRV